MAVAVLVSRMAGRGTGRGRVVGGEIDLRVRGLLEDAALMEGLRMVDFLEDSMVDNTVWWRW